MLTAQSALLRSGAVAALEILEATQSSVWANKSFLGQVVDMLPDSIIQDIAVLAHSARIGEEEATVAKFKVIL